MTITNSAIHGASVCGDFDTRPNAGSATTALHPSTPSAIVKPWPAARATARTYLIGPESANGPADGGAARKHTVGWLDVDDHDATLTVSTLGGRRDTGFPVDLAGRDGQLGAITLLLPAQLVFLLQVLFNNPGIQ